MGRYAKSWVAASGAALTMLTAAAPIVPPAWKPWTEVAIAVWSAVAVHQVPNRPASGK